MCGGSFVLKNTAMNIRKIFLSIIVLSAVVLPGQAQNDSFLDFYRQRTQEFKDWRSKANSEFTEYLAAAWQEFMVQRGKEDPIGPVAEEPVYYNPQEHQSASHGLPASGRMAVPAVVAPVPAVAAEYAGNGMVSIDFFGLQESVPFAENMRLPRIMASEQDASKGWNVLSQSDFMPAVEAFQDMRDKHALSDWALYTAVKKYTDAVYIEEYVNEKVLTQMFILSQMQYKARVGSSGGELILLLPFTAPIYQVSYISDGDEDFYIFSYSRLNSQDPLYTFSDDFSGADRKLDLVIDKQMVVDYDYYRLKTLASWAQYVDEEVKVPLNIPCVKFTLDYPQSDLLIYHRSAVDPELQKAVFTQVRYKILKDGMNELEAVGFVLTLIQRGFDYKTDYEMFGRSKPLFVEESFYYGANNCKDRVLLFSWLVKDLLGLDVAMFCYKGHVACGVALPGEVTGDGYDFEGRRYVMCDPTYIGAPVGATMPKYRDVQPQIILL